MRLPATFVLVLTLPLLWLFGVFFTPANEAGGVLALSVADAILSHIRPWVYVTAGFYHPHVLQLVVVLPLAFSLAKRVEPALGSLNVARLLLFSNICASFVLFVQLFVLYIVFRNPIYLNTSLSGFAGGLTALLVALMQPTPLATSPLVPGLKLRFYPLVAVIGSMGLSVVGMMSSSLALRTSLVGAGPFAALGGYFGWFYLRFLNKNRLDGTRGDTSDAFAFVVLLPDALHRIVAPLAGFSLSVVKLCGFFKSRSNKKHVTPTKSLLPVLTSDATTDDPIAERRKARAMKALDAKLAKLAHANEPNEPNELNPQTVNGSTSGLASLAPNVLPTTNNDDTEAQA